MDAMTAQVKTSLWRRRVMHLLFLVSGFAGNTILRENPKSLWGWVFIALFVLLGARMITQMLAARKQRTESGRPTGGGTFVVNLEGVPKDIEGALAQWALNGSFTKHPTSSPQRIVYARFGWMAAPMYIAIKTGPHPTVEAWAQRGFWAIPIGVGGRPSLVPHEELSDLLEILGASKNKGSVQVVVKGVPSGVESSSMLIRYAPCFQVRLVTVCSLLAIALGLAIVVSGLAQKEAKQTQGAVSAGALFFLMGIPFLLFAFRYSVSLVLQPENFLIQRHLLWFVRKATVRYSEISSVKRNPVSSSITVSLKDLSKFTIPSTVRRVEGTVADHSVDPRIQSNPIAREMVNLMDEIQRRTGNE